MKEPEANEEFVKCLLNELQDEALNRLKNRLDEGQELPGSPKEAILKLVQMADGRDIDAQYILGSMFEKGLEVEASLDKALYWFREGAESGDPSAKKKAGEICDRLGMLEWQDTGEYDYWSIGERYGNTDCIRNKGCAIESDDTPEAYAEAMRLYQKAAKMGDMKACRCIGNLYENGRGVEQSDEKAFEWYAKSAEMGYDVAQCDLGHMYRDGRGVEQSYEKAMELYERSASQGCSLA